MDLVAGDKKTCSGCEACVSVCPKHAITMKPDKFGFIFPYIDKSLCIDCGLCMKKCQFKNDEISNSKSKVYAVVNKNEEMCISSASGGAFTALAQWIFDKNGIVVGCAWDEHIMPKHIIISSMKDIGKLQGSKYVQSSMGVIYEHVKEYLEHDRYVLFSGTPCQCAAIRAYLNRKYEKLFCVELLCHGVPNAKMFREYLDMLEKKMRAKIIDIHFRDKKLGWGALLRIDYLKEGRHRIKYLKPEESYYYYYFFKRSLFFRESCYSCKYASEHRLSDFTIGDYWGGQNFHPTFDQAKGISVLIATGEKAINTLPELRNYLLMEESSIDYVKIENGQVSKPSLKDSSYDELLERLTTRGSEAFEEEYHKRYRKNVFFGKLKRLVPLWVKRILLRTKRIVAKTNSQIK
ncbi:MAG: 4Fe-4S binding protein [Clostridiaceae bacterium]|nr:4Fe-4S binding protein [Clostridiaceae bacterium]